MRETIHLHPRAELVPPAILDPPFAGEGRFLMRDLSTFLLDRHLRRLARMRSPLELRLARLLGRMHALSGHLDLGFARLSDYVSERLGFSARRMHSLLRIERGLRSLPATAAAFEAGRLSQSQVLLLLRVATPADEEAWLEAAAGLSVRRLARKVREALSRRASDARGVAPFGGGAPEGGDPGTPPPEASAAPARSNGETAGAAEAAGGVGAAGDADAAGRVGTTGGVDAAGAIEAPKDPKTAGRFAAAKHLDVAADLDEEADPGREIGFTAPRALRARWDWAVELCRKAAGATEPVWRCAEFFAAEYLSGVPDLPSLLARALAEPADQPADGGAAACDPDAGAPGGVAFGDSDGVDFGDLGPGGAMAGCSEDAGFGGSDSDFSMAGDSENPDFGGGSGCPTGRPREPGEDEGVELFEEVLRAYQDEACGLGWAPPESGFETVIPEPTGDEAGDHPRGLDARLRSLVRLRQTLAWHQGRLLRTFAAHGLYRDLGFFSLGRYCVERLGIGLRRARRLIALERHLLELPALARAYRAGEVTWVQATEIARVANESDEKEWIRLAQSVTVRRLSQEVAVALARAEEAAGGSGHRGPRRPGPPGIEPSGRIALRSPAWPPVPQPEAPAGDEVQTSAPAGDDPGVQTSARAKCGDGVQTSAPAGEDPRVQTFAADPAGVIDGWTSIRFWAPHDVADLFGHALQVCRRLEGEALDDWQCVARLIDHFRTTWAVRSDPQWQRRYRTHERDGWRCRVPGCSSRRNLQEHHVHYRSHGGSDDPGNLVSLCVTHHQKILHQGRLRVHRLPEGLLAWELGARPDGSALARYVEDVRWEAAREGTMPP